jgi:hypothetical protein
MEFRGSGLDRHGNRNLVGVAAGQTAIHRFDRREGDWNRFENSAVRQ